MNSETVYTYVAILDFNTSHIQISFPDLSEALSQANTLEQAHKRAIEVLKLTIQSRLEDKEDLPVPTPFERIKLDKNQYTTIVSCAITKKVKYIKKTLTIPEDLNEAAEKKGINFSQLLQQALRDKLYANEE